jgi:hypothetical protein
MPVKRPQDKSGPRQEFLNSYSEYSKTLRTWLVAFGIGGPVLFLTHDAAWHSLANSGSAFYVGNLFFSGVAAQVLMAFINKAIMWSLYCGEVLPNFKLTRRYKIADRLSEAFWLDVSFDVVTMILFSIATIKIFSILVTYQGPGGSTL